MAKIKGFELKGIAEFKGHEGEPLIQGNVYYKGKKVGFYSQDAWGGMDIFKLDYNLDNNLRNKIEDITNNYVGGVLFEKIDDLYNETYKVNFKYEQKGYEYLFMDLLQLKEHENDYRKYYKKYPLNTVYIVYKDLFTRGICGAYSDDVIEQKYPNKTYFKYTSLNDFVID